MSYKTDKLPLAQDGDLRDADSTARPVDLWERSEPRAMINLVPPALQQAFMTAAMGASDLFCGDERTLLKKLRESERTPTPTDNRLRLAFWMEYDRAQSLMKNMRVDNIFAGICTRNYFYGNYLANPAKVAWLLMPPTSYVVKMEETLDFGLDQLRDILEIPHGTSNVKLMELKAKIVAMVDLRVKGAVPLKIDQRNMNINVATTAEQVSKIAMGGTMAELDVRLKELERRERKALNLPADITVESEVVKP